MNTASIIIGSTGTIGKRLVPLICQDYENIILSGRDLDGLEKQKEKFLQSYPNKNICILGLDVFQNNTPEKIENFLTLHNLTLSSIVNTSYYSSNGKFTDISYTEHLKTIQTNITGFMNIVYWYMLYSQKKNISPKILSFSSLCSLHGIPNTAIYSGTKSFLVSFFQALSIENPQLKVTVSCPGPFSEQEKAENIFKSILNKVLPSPESISRKSYKAFKKGKLIIYPDILSKLYRFKIIRIIFLGFLKKIKKDPKNI